MFYAIFLIRYTTLPHYHVKFFILNWNTLLRNTTFNAKNTYLQL